MVHPGRPGYMFILRDVEHAAALQEISIIEIMYEQEEVGRRLLSGGRRKLRHLLVLFHTFICIYIMVI
jgi:hypothetical protein